MHSFATFYNDPRGREYAMQNKVTFGCTVVGMFGATLVILQKCGLDTNQERLWGAIQMAPLFRIFVTNARFRHVVRACYAGLMSLRPFVALFCIVFYTFSMLAYYAFARLELRRGEVFSEQLNFSTFGDSCLAMFQIFIGAGWVSVATSAVQQTSHAYTWFMLFYRFVVGVLFAELIKGVLIATFGIVNQLDACVIGEVLHEFNHELEVLSHKEQVVYVKGLGIPAQFCLDAGHQTHHSGAVMPAHTDAVNHHVLEVGWSKNSQNPDPTNEDELGQVFGSQQIEVNQLGDSGFTTDPITLGEITVGTKTVGRAHSPSPSI